ncbi:MAG: efflux RND transporter periplasmic adaptor subunit, partial [Ideonella sp.]|nr:efflux RND transporter periplasmic adaptor subunit [Ideonella sp.]
MTPTTRRFRPAMLATAAALTALLGGATLVATLHSGAAQADAAPAAPPALPVPVATVAASEVSAWSEFSGRLEAVDRVELRSRAAGTVQAVHFREGSLVAKGALLFTIDPAPYAAAVERAQAQVAAAQARLTHAGAELQRAQRLWDDRAIAQREFDERANAQREADANLRAARAALQSAQLDL